MKTKYIFLTLVGLFVASCANDEYEVDTPDTDVVRVFAGSPGTRIAFDENGASTYANWEKGDLILLAAEGQRLEYEATTTNDEAMVTEFFPHGDALFNRDGKAVYACTFPAVVDYESAMATHLPDMSVYNLLDFQPFIYAIDTIRDGQLNLRFHHPYAYLKLTFTSAILPPDTISLGAVGIISDEIIAAKNANFYFKTQSLDVVEGSNTMLIEQLDGVAGPGPDLTKASFMLYVPILPQPEGVKIKIEARYTLGGGWENTYPYYKLEKTVPAGGFLAGHVYTLTLDKPDISSLAVGPTSFEHLTSDKVRATSALSLKKEMEVSEKGFCYSLSPEPTVSDYKVQSATPTEEFSAEITGLIPDSIYHVRSYAISYGTVAYGEETIMSSAGIYTLEDLIAFRDARNAGSEVAKWRNPEGVINIYADIDMSSIDNWTKIDWIGAGVWQEDGDRLDGNGHIISGLKMSDAGVDGHIGFVGRLRNLGSIRNLHLRAGSIEIAGENIDYCGAICAYSDNGDISDCSSDVIIAVTNSKSVAAGICGYGGYIERCINWGNITGGYKISGICGELTGVIIDCVNYGTLTSQEGTSMVSGMSYNMYGNSSISIRNCENHGTLHGEYADNVGGVEAFATYTRIVDCVNYGNVIGGDKSSVGGICGRSYGATLSDNRNEGDVSGPETALVGGICGDGVIGDNNINGGTVNGEPGTEENAVGVKTDTE